MGKSTQKNNAIIYKIEFLKTIKMQLQPYLQQLRVTNKQLNDDTEELTVYANYKNHSARSEEVSLASTHSWRCGYIIISERDQKGDE